jgi:non-ribosomal peptide synthetase component F
VADFWRERLRGVGELELPTDRPRPTQLSRRGHSVETPLPAEVAARVQAFARQRRTTTFLTYLAAFTTLLQQLSGQPDIVVGTSTSGRERAQLQHLVGYFVTVISVRSRGCPGDTFQTVLERAAREQLDALSHLDLPFEEVVKAVAPERANGRAPLFRVTFVVTEEPPAPQLIGAECDQVFHNHGIARFDMSWVVVEGQRPGVAVQYSTDLFDRSTIERFTARYARLVDWLVSHPAEPVAAAPAW